jgi:hypothetical protein
VGHGVESEALFKLEEVSNTDGKSPSKLRPTKFFLENLGFLRIR